VLQIHTELRTSEERIAAMHARASEMRFETALRRSRIIVASAAFVSLALIMNLALIMPAAVERVMSPGGIDEMQGSILSGSPIIGYVVIGIIAFMLGAAVTLLCFKTRPARGPMTGGRPMGGDKENHI